MLFAIDLNGELDVSRAAVGDLWSVPCASRARETYAQFDDEHRKQSPHGGILMRNGQKGVKKDSGEIWGGNPRATRSLPLNLSGIWTSEKQEERVI